MRCPTGHARITPGFRLTAKYVIHTVGPIWNGGSAGERSLLASCYRESLKLALEHRLSSLAFPSISCGVYGFPAGEASRIAVREVRAHFRVEGDGQTTLRQVLLVAFDAKMRGILETALKEA